MPKGSASATKSSQGYLATAAVKSAEELGAAGVFSHEGPTQETAVHRAKVKARDVNNQNSQLLEYLPVTPPGERQVVVFVHLARAYLFRLQTSWSIQDMRDMLLDTIVSQPVRLWNIIVIAFALVDLGILLQLFLVLAHDDEDGWVFTQTGPLMVIMASEVVIDTVLYTNPFVLLMKLRPYIVAVFYVMYFVFAFMWYEGKMSDAYDVMTEHAPAAAAQWPDRTDMAQFHCANTTMLVNSVNFTTPSMISDIKTMCKLNESLQTTFLVLIARLVAFVVELAAMIVEDSMIHVALAEAMRSDERHNCPYVGSFVLFVPSLCMRGRRCCGQRASGIPGGVSKRTPTDFILTVHSVDDNAWCARLAKDAFLCTDALLEQPEQRQCCCWSDNQQSCWASCGLCMLLTNVICCVRVFGFVCGAIAEKLPCCGKDQRGAPCCQSEFEDAVADYAELIETAPASAVGGAGAYAGGASAAALV